MINITNTILFDENLLLSKQSAEFQQWYNENVNILINDKLKPDLLDEYSRPMSYTVVVNTFQITIYPLYIYQDSSNWACRDFQLTIKPV